MNESSTNDLTKLGIKLSREVKDIINQQHDFLCPKCGTSGKTVSTIGKVYNCHRCEESYKYEDKLKTPVEIVDVRINEFLTKYNKLIELVNEQDKYIDLLGKECQRFATEFIARPHLQTSEEDVQLGNELRENIEKLKTLII